MEVSGGGCNWGLRGGVVGEGNGKGDCMGGGGRNV